LNFPASGSFRDHNSCERRPRQNDRPRLFYGNRVWQFRITTDKSDERDKKKITFIPFICGKTEIAESSHGSKANGTAKSPRESMNFAPFAGFAVNRISVELNRQWRIINL